MANTLTQKQAILEHLQTRGSLTQLECTLLYGATRLGAIIFDLKKAGHLIISRKEEHKTKYGRKTHVARYYYVEEGGLK
jgi:hypothetical protein